MARGRGIVGAAEANADRFAWPLYFSTVDIDTPRVRIKKGQLWPFQDKQVIKGMGSAAGCPDSWTRPFSDLPYVAVLNVGTAALAQSITERQLDLEAARALLET